MFYALPEHAHFYPELLNLLEGTGGTGSHASAAASAAAASVTALYCKWDALSLARVVGGGRAKKMLGSASSTFMFC